MIRPRDIRISTCLNGFIINIDCQNVVVEGGYEDLQKLLKGYYDDPETFERNFLKSAENNQKYKMFRAGGGSLEEVASVKQPIERADREEARGY